MKFLFFYVIKIQCTKTDWNGIARKWSDHKVTNKNPKNRLDKWKILKNDIFNNLIPDALVIEQFWYKNISVKEIISGYIL